MQHVDKDGLCAQRGTRAGINGEPRGALYVGIYKSKGKATKQTGRRKKKAKPGHTNMATQGHKCNKEMMTQN